MLLEIWARGPNPSAASTSPGLRQQLNDTEHQELRDLCGRTLYHSLTHAVHMYGKAGGPHAFVATGDILNEWIRDSSVQLGVLLPRLAQHPALRQVRRTATGCAMPRHALLHIIQCLVAELLHVMP
jgi:meiotically up-regulated gene 157 (Mug157) protein